MTSALFLRIALPAALIPAGAAILLSGTAAQWYTKLLLPGLLLLSCALSLWVALMYRSHLKRAFFSLAVFFFSYGLANITWVLDWLGEASGDQFLTVLFIWQVASYGVLLLACLSILRAIGVRRLNPRAMGVVIGLALLAVGIVGFAVPAFTQQFAVSKSAAALLLLIRIFDMLVMLMLVPVLLLYVQNARAKYQESVSFSVIVLGVVASLVLVYVYELLRQESLAQIAATEFQKGSVLDALYIFGYLTVVAGLYAHRKHQTWSFQKVNDQLIPSP